MQADVRQILRDAFSKSDSFRQCVFSAPFKPGECEKAVVRPVLVKDERLLQFTATGTAGSRSTNFTEKEALEEAARLLEQGFSRLHVQTREGDAHIRITRKGRVLVSRGAPSVSDAEPGAGHDRIKEHPLSGRASKDFLMAIGWAASSGEIRPSMQAKFRQVNGFIRLLDPLLAARNANAGPLRMVDFGCGSAYLSFALYHYVTHVKGLPAVMTGVDRNEGVILKCRQLRDRLGWKDVDFLTGDIADYRAEAPPEWVLSLHACDTATDAALARGVLWGSRCLVAAPCCQHELHHQLKAAPFGPLLRHGILRERLADLLTDTFRALILRIMGYRVDVVEFVSPDSTPKNLLIRAEKSAAAKSDSALREYRELKAYWKIEPEFERLLGPNFPAS